METHTVSFLKDCSLSRFVFLSFHASFRECTLIGTHRVKMLGACVIFLGGPTIGLVYNQVLGFRVWGVGFRVLDFLVMILLPALLLLTPSS